MEAWLFSFVVPYLAIAAALACLLKTAGLDVTKSPLRPVVLALPAVLVLLPVKHFPPARFIAGFNVSFSITLAVLLLSLFLGQITAVWLLDRRACRTLMLLGLISGLCLYPSAMNLVPVDLYRLGWGSVFLTVPLFFLTIVLVLTGNRAGPVLAACVAGYALKLLESDNLWDYLLDPFLVIWCFFALLAEGFAFARRLLRGRSTDIGYRLSGRGSE